MQNLVLIHGAVGSASQTRLLTPYLKDIFHLHHLELSGHGKKSERDIEFSIKNFAAEVEDYIRAKNLQGTHLFGYSMGGYIGLYLAATKPNLIGKLMTLGTKFEWTPEIAQKEKGMLNSEKIKEKVPAFALQLEAKHGKNWQKVLMRTAAMMVSLGADNLIEQVNLSRVNIPVRLLLAEHDNMVSNQETVHIQRLLPHADYKNLPDSKHPLEQVHLEGLSAEIKGFFSEA